ncbi:MAG: CHASE2 domain-containing protein, partial [Proteobacteria bacterium]|nr:CHASE2 domain-containing protein [Pseudomonadota bacterium]
MKNVLKRYDIIITVLLFLLIIPAEFGEWFSFVENQTLSIRHILRQTYGNQEAMSFPSDKVAIVVQDEAFFEEYGSYPIRREDIGKLAYILSKLGAKVIMVDMLMDFPSSYNEDPIIAEYFKKAGNTILVSQLVFEDKLDNNFERINYPTKTIHEVSETAYSNHTKSGDMLNRLRLYPDLIKEYKEWPISVKAVANYLGVEPQILGKTMVLGKLQIKLDQFNDFRNDFSVFKADEKIRFLSQDPNIGISALDIMELDPEDEEDLEEYKYLIEGKIVFLGDTWEVSHDIFDTIIGEVYGVEQLAQEVATILKGAPLRSASLISEVSLSLIVLGFLIGIHFIERPVLRYFSVVVLIVVYILFCSYAYIDFDLVFSMSYTLIAGIFGFTLINVYLFIQENEQRNFIKGAFGQYLSPDVIEALVEDPDKL